MSVQINCKEQWRKYDFIEEGPVKNNLKTNYYCVYEKYFCKLYRAKTNKYFSGVRIFSIMLISKYECKKKTQMNIAIYNSTKSQY